MAPHSSTLAWKIPQTEEPGRLQSMGSLRVGHDWATSLSLFTSCIGEGNGNSLQCSCLENPRDGGTWWAAIYGVAQSRTQLKRLSMSFVWHLVFYVWRDGLCLTSEAAWSHLYHTKSICHFGNPTTMLLGSTDHMERPVIHILVNSFN